jgi:hypothetical protein
MYGHNIQSKIRRLPLQQVVRDPRYVSTLSDNMHKIDPNSHAPRNDIVYATCFHVATQFREVENVVHRFNK